jgi:leucyl/phenylalanyl-tRNA--protein transferase
MFSRVSNASKACLITLVEHLAKLGFELIDSQVYTRHLEILGAREIPRSEYLILINDLLRY